MNKLILLPLSVLAGVLLAIPARAQSLLLGRIVSTGDGNMIKVQRRGQTQTLVLGCIDMPDVTQRTWGKLATDRFKQLLPIGQTIQWREITRDSYGRTIAEVFISEESINLQLVTEGMAVLYPKYIDECHTAKAEYLLAESEAQQQRIGLWQESKPCMPWEHRRRLCS